MQQFEYSDAGLALTKRFEGLRLEAYKDCAGVWTIGYGHTGQDVQHGRVVDEAEAESLLRSDLRDAVACVNRAVTHRLEQPQFDALVDFCYNVGRGNFVRSSLLAKVNLGDFAGAAARFGWWVNANQVPVAGLVRRRASESAMFLGRMQGNASPDR